MVSICYQQCNFIATFGGSLFLGDRYLLSIFIVFIAKTCSSFLRSSSFHSDDYLKILQGGRKVRTLSGVYRYNLFGWGDSDDLDDDCDDDDLDGDKDGNDGDYKNYGRERSKKMFGPPGGNRPGFPMRSRLGVPYVARVYIPGTGELISIIFKSDDDDNKRGFEAAYRVSPGAFFKRFPMSLIYVSFLFSSFHFTPFSIKMSLLFVCRMLASLSFSLSCLILSSLPALIKK